MFRSEKGQSIAALAVLLSWSLDAGAQSVAIDAKAKGSAKGSEKAGTTAEASADADVAEVDDEEAAAATLEEVEDEPEPEPVVEPEPEPEPEPEVAVAVAVVNEDDEEEEEMTDHEQVVGGLGIGLLGVTTIRNTTTTYGVQSSNVPIVGARFWLTELLGVQAGVGFSTTSGVRKDDIAENEDTYDGTQWNMAFHAGVPISFFDGDHYNFVLIPEATLGYSTGRTKDDANIPEDQGVKQAAWLLSTGVRAGAEMQFGFIGIPHLSLQGAVGIQATYTSAMIETVEGGELVRRNYQTFNAGTTNNGEPWDLFIGSLAALYYFDL